MNVHLTEIIFSGTWPMFSKNGTAEDMFLFFLSFTLAFFTVIGSFILHCLKYTTLPITGMPIIVRVISTIFKIK